MEKTSNILESNVSADLYSVYGFKLIYGILIKRRVSGQLLRHWVLSNLDIFDRLQQIILVLMLSIQARELFLLCHQLYRISIKEWHQFLAWKFRLTLPLELYWILWSDQQHHFQRELLQWKQRDLVYLVWQDELVLSWVEHCLAFFLLYQQEQHQHVFLLPILHEKYIFDGFISDSCRLFLVSSLEDGNI